ncbi:sphingomyelin phosphodiesterase-like isoform X2 [Euwallacea fornicatus]
MLLLLLSFFTLASNTYTSEVHQLAQTLQQEFEELQETRYFLGYFNNTLNKLELSQMFIADGEENQLKDEALCSACYIAANFLINERRNNISWDTIAFEAVTGCAISGILTPEVCKGVVDLNLPIIAYIVDVDHTVTGERMCDLFLQYSGCNSTVFEWTIDIPAGETVAKLPQSNPESTFNVLHISDFHYDPLYTPGKTKDCREPFCCQRDQTDGDPASGTCGYWSEYTKTDSSEALVDEAIRKANEFDFDYVYFTGDIVSHRVWGTSVEGNTEDLKLVFRKMKSAFKDKPIYIAIGNHESNPENEFPLNATVDASLSCEWLYDLIISEFSQWLPEEAKQDLMKGGYYSVSPRKGFRVVVLNSILAYLDNWWLNLNDVDPLGQLAWLSKTLKEAEDNGEVVHILAHIPGGKYNLLKVWSREYHKIIERFSNSIAAQFNGHTHKDQIMVYYSSSNTSEAINVAINGASIMPDNSNPSFKIINVDNSNFDVMNTQEWTFNLTKANESPDTEPK